jgi:DNA-binding transcriptional ArsR family regulator
VNLGVHSPSALRSGEPEIAVLSTILVHGPISRKEIASKLGLSQATLTRLAKPLLDFSLVEETADRFDGPGRPSRPLVGRSGAHRFVGIKLTGDKIFGVSTDVLARELHRESQKLSSHEPSIVAAEVAAMASALASDGELVAVGIALGGSTHDGRTVHRAPFLEWRDVAFADLVEDALTVPVVSGQRPQRTRGR